MELSQIGLMCEPITPPYAEAISPDRSNLIDDDKDSGVLKENVYKSMPQTEGSSSFCRPSSHCETYKSSVCLNNSNFEMISDFEQNQYKSDEMEENFTDSDLVYEHGMFQNRMIENSDECNAEVSNLNEAAHSNVVESDSGTVLCKGDFEECLEFSSHEPQASHSSELQAEVEVQDFSEFQEAEGHLISNVIDYSNYFTSKTEQGSSDFHEIDKSPNVVDYSSYFSSETDTKENVCKRKNKDSHYAQDYGTTYKTDNFESDEMSDMYYNEMQSKRHKSMSHYSHAPRGSRGFRGFRGFRGSFAGRRAWAPKTRGQRQFPNRDSIDRALLTGERILFSSQSKNKPFSDLREVIDVYRQRFQNSDSRKSQNSSEPHYKDDPMPEMDQYYHKYRQLVRDQESEHYSDSHYSGRSFESSYSHRGRRCLSSCNRFSQNRNYFERGQENEYLSNSRRDFQDQSLNPCLDISPDNILISVKRSSHQLRDNKHEILQKSDQRKVMISDRMERHEYSRGRSGRKSGDSNWEDDNWEDDAIYHKSSIDHQQYDYRLEELDAQRWGGCELEESYIVERRIISQARKSPKECKNMEDKSLVELEDRRRSLMEAFYHAFSPIRNIPDEDLHDEKSKRLSSSSNSDSIRSKKRKHNSEDENDCKKSKKKKHKKHHHKNHDAKDNNDVSENKNIDYDISSLVQGEFTEFPNPVPIISISDENCEVMENCNAMIPHTEVWNVEIDNDDEDDDFETICIDTVARDGEYKACNKSFHDNWDGTPDGDIDYLFDREKHLAKSQNEFDKKIDVVEISDECTQDKASRFVKIDDAVKTNECNQNESPDILQISSEIEDDGDEKLEKSEVDDINSFNLSNYDADDVFDQQVEPKDGGVKWNNKINEDDVINAEANLSDEVVEKQDEVIEVDSDVEASTGDVKGFNRNLSGENYEDDEDDEEGDECLVEGESGEEASSKQCLNKSDETEEQLQENSFLLLSSDDQNHAYVLDDEENVYSTGDKNGNDVLDDVDQDNGNGKEISPIDDHSNKRKKLSAGDEDLFCYSPTENDRLLKSLTEDVLPEEKHKRFLRDMNSGACDPDYIPGLSPTMSDSPQGAYSPSSQPPSAIEESSPVSPTSPPQCATPQGNVGVPDMMQLLMQTINNQISLNNNNNNMNLIGNINTGGGDLFQQLLTKAQSAYKTPIGQTSANQNGLMAFSTNPLLSLPFLFQSQKSVSPAILHYLSLQNLSTSSSICDLDTSGKTNESAKMSYSPFDINTISPRSEDAMSFSPPSIVAGCQDNNAEGPSFEKDTTIRKRVKASNKIDLQQKLVHDIKQLLRPVYKKGKITKEDYKDILRKTVPKIVNTNKLSYNRDKVSKFAEAYIQKVIATKKYYSKKGANPT